VDGLAGSRPVAKLSGTAVVAKLGLFCSGWSWPVLVTVIVVSSEEEKVMRLGRSELATVST